MPSETRYDPLPSRILDLLTQDRKLAYAQITPVLTVAAASSNLCESFSEPDRAVGIEGTPLGELFWEFIGAESGLADILNGSSPGYLIENANREQPDGTLRYITLRVVALDGQRPSAGLLLTVEDNTAIGALEQMLIQERNNLRLAQSRLARANDALVHLNQMKSLFLSIAAHDLRAPLTAVRGYAELAKSDGGENGIDTAEKDGFLDIILSQVDLLNRLISDLLDLDMIERGKLVIHPAACDLASLVRRVAGVLSPIADDQGLTIHIQLPETAISIQADPDRIQQILYNLIGNALKYTPSGGHVEVTCAEEKKYAVFQVSDNGRGIAPDELSHVFELYHRSEEAIQSEVRGTGLGLYIVKSLVDAMGGKVSVTSQVEHGTTFTIRFPRPST